MDNLKKLFKNKRSLIWFIVTCVLVALLLVVTLVTTQVQLVYGTVNLILGGARPVTADGSEPQYVLDNGLETKDDVYAAAKEFNKRLEEEGAVLLKNDGSLPIKKNAKISVFGKNSVNLVYSGSGSSAASGEGVIDLYGGLTNFEVNPALKSFYLSSASGSGRGANPGMDGKVLTGFATGETPVASYTAEVKNSFSSYNDAAVVVISRIGGEGFDLPRTMVEGYGGSAVAGANADAHYLQLDNNEKALLEMVCASFDNVTVLLNTSSIMELGELENNDKINAILWMGLPGQTGAAVIGDILDGTVNPSGRTTDTYARNFATIPSSYNFGDNMITDGNRYTIDGKGRTAYFVDYEEGVYVGYRYFETRGFTDGEDWYNANVVYPFGYGLSYTQFEWTVKSVSKADGSTLGKADKITVEVEVKNTGDAAGKDVVEMYYKVPYSDGGIEKPYIQLGAFEKTGIIEPGKTDTVTLEMNVEDMKSYDYGGVKVENGGYILEEGHYSIVIAQNVHAAPVAEYGFEVREDILYDGDTVTNRFDDVSEKIGTYLSRADWEGTMPVSPTAEEREVTTAWLSQITYKANDASDTPWYAANAPTTGSSDDSVSFKDLKGVDFDDEKWDLFMNRLTLEEMASLVGIGAFGTIALESYGIPLTYHEDGPAGFANFMDTTGNIVYSVCNYAAECVIGASWNKELAYEMGKMIGNEGIVGNEILPYSGWYGPAVNIHRSPFGGRNWEYYSEDGFLSGVMASEVIKGCNEKGVYVFIKHFAVNEQETDRSNNGLIVWTNEQALREIYLKPFEIALKNNDKAGVMSSFTRIGFTWTGGSYELLTEVLRKEWGVNCAVITDYAIGQSYMNVNQMIRAGGDLALTQDDSKVPSISNITPTQAAAIRRAAKNVLYAVVNSNAMDVEITGYKLPVWQIALIVADCVVFAALAVWGYFAISSVLKKQPSEN